MKENIFTINNRLQKGEITTEQAKNELLVLFGVVEPKGTLCETCNKLDEITITLCKECYLESWD